MKMNRLVEMLTPILIINIIIHKIHVSKKKKKTEVKYFFHFIPGKFSIKDERLQTENSCCKTQNKEQTNFTVNRM